VELSYDRQTKIAENIKKRPRGVLRVFVAFIILAALISGVLVPSYFIKEDAIQRLYTDNVLARITVDVRRSIQEIESGLQNAENPAEVSDIDRILRDISNSSSYTLGVFFTDNNNVLLHSIGRPAGGSTEYYDLILPVKNEEGFETASVRVRLDKDIINNAAKDMIKQEFIQSLAIGLELLGLGLILLMIIRPKTTGILVTVILFTLIALSLDFTLFYIQYSAAAESLTVQTVNRITQILQNDADLLKTAGASLSSIYDLNDWLKNLLHDIPAINTMSINSHMRVTLNASTAFIEQYSIDLIWCYVAVFAMFAGAAVIAIISRVVFVKYRSKKHSK